MVDAKKIEEILTRGVGEFIDPDGNFRKKLNENPEKIVIKFGVDPTRPDIHLGHAVVLRKLRQFQDLGCKVVFLVGDFTAQIGDPTGKSKIRPEMDQQEIVNIVNTFITQIPKILKIQPNENEKQKYKDKIIFDQNGFVLDSPWFAWMRNADWFQNVVDITIQGATDEVFNIQDPDTGVVINIGPETLLKDPKTLNETRLGSNPIILSALVHENTRLQKNILQKKIRGVSLINLLSILRRVTHSQLIERDMFQERIKKDEPLFMHEMLYPVIQGIDSVLISDIYGTCDIEVGGTDQTFNMLMGRKIMEMGGKEQQAVLSFKILQGLDGKEKMSKSLDNYIGINDDFNDMYGKVMSIPDNLIGHYFELCTFTPIDRIIEIQKEIESEKTNPKDLKMELARQIVALYHGEQKAQSAEDQWISKFEKKEIPENIPEYMLVENLLETVLSNGLLSSKGEYRRVLEQNGIHNLTTNETITDIVYIPEKGTVIKIGKQKFFKII